MNRSIIALVGKTQAGKSALMQHACERIPELLEPIISTSTRPRRRPEDDLLYHLVSDREFALMRDRGDFVNIEPYGDHLYGYARADIRKVLEERQKFGVCAITQGAIAALREAGYSVLPVRIEPVYVEPRRTSPERERDDAARELIPVRYAKTIYNYFSPGGLERATQELVQFVQEASR